MAGLGRKEWSPGDTLTASDVNGYLMDQSVMVFAGTAARASAIPSPSAGMVAYSTATSLQVYDGTDWVDLSTGYGVATGGSSSSITVGGINYTLLTFTSDATLTVTKAGLFDVAVQAGGAGGNNGVAGGFRGGGGGAGGLIITTVYIPDTTYSIDIGAGGALQVDGSPGGIVPLLYAAGGGKGGSNLVGTGGPGFVNGGGGGGGSWGTTAGGTGVAGFGFNGASGTSGGAGGGGAGVTANAVAGTGGTGYDKSLFIGGSSSNIGVGGNGGALSAAGATGAANTGNGGGGGGDGAAAGAGGSGVVYVRFKV